VKKRKKCSTPEEEETKKPETRVSVFFVFFVFFVVSTKRRKMKTKNEDTL